MKETNVLKIKKQTMYFLFEKKNDCFHLSWCIFFLLLFQNVFCLIFPYSLGRNTKIKRGTLQHHRLQVRASNVLVQHSYTTEGLFTEGALVHRRNEVFASYVVNAASYLVVEK